MIKFLAVIKREYVQRVRTKFFVVATILAPVIMASFVALPMLLASIQTGGATRLAASVSRSTVRAVKMKNKPPKSRPPKP